MNDSSEEGCFEFLIVGHLQIRENVVLDGLLKHFMQIEIVLIDVNKRSEAPLPKTVLFRECDVGDVGKSHEHEFLDLFLVLHNDDAILKEIGHLLIYPFLYETFIMLEQFRPFRFRSRNLGNLHGQFSANNGGFCRIVETLFS